MAALSSSSARGFGRRLATRRLAPYALLGLLAAGLAAQTSSGRGAGRTSDDSVMKELSQRFQELESELEGGGPLREAAAGLALAAARIAELRPADAAVALEFDRRAALLSHLASEVGELGGSGRIEGARQAFEELRATCVGCHVGFRRDNAERGDWPARGNTVAGEIALEDIDGKPLEDRSWVLVFLEGAPPDPCWIPARDDPRISQSGRRFQPRILPVLVGSRVEFPNDDTIFHNVFSLSKVAPFDLGVYEPGETASVRMERTGLVKVYCNIHPEMAASIVVLDNPWFALTDAAGRFAVCGAPDGQYVLRAWNDMGAEVSQPLELAGGQVFERRITLRETRRVLSHANKFGKPYAEKYR